MDADIAEAKQRLDTIDRLGDAHKKQLIELQQVLDRATAILTAGSADIGAKEAKEETDIAALQAHVDDIASAFEDQRAKRADAENQIEIRMAALEQSQAKVVDRVAPTLPDDKEQLWLQAGARLQAGQRDQGRHFYRVFIQRFPDDPRASRAYFAIGQSLFEEKQFAKAAAEFQRLLDRYPRSAEVPAAMGKLAHAFMQLHFCTDARSLLGDLVKRFPRSPSAAEAEKDLKTLRRLPRTACTS